jgi:hypothetical protein
MVGGDKVGIGVGGREKGKGGSKWRGRYIQEYQNDISFSKTGLDGKKRKETT